MTIKTTIPALAACLALGVGGAALAEGSPNTASTYGAGGATANSQGVSAGGEVSGDAMTRHNDRKAAHQNRRKSNRTDTPAANSATTYGTGVVSTTRDAANAGVTTGAAASGSGAQSAGSTVDAYGETNKSGSNADIYGDSAATSGTKTR